MLRPKWLSSLMLIFKILTSIVFKLTDLSLKKLKANLVFEKIIKSKSLSFGLKKQNQYLNIYFLIFLIKLINTKRITNVTGAKIMPAIMTATKNFKKALFQLLKSMP